MKTTLTWKNGFKHELNVTLEGHRSYIEELTPVIRENVKATMNKQKPQHDSGLFKEV